MPLNQRLPHLSFFEEDDAWHAGVSEGLFSVLKSLMSIDAECKMDRFSVQWLPSPTDWIANVLLRGAVISAQTGRYSGCNASRCLSFLANHEGIWPCLLAALKSIVERAIFEKVPPAARGVLNTSARHLLRFLCEVMAGGATGRIICKRYAEISIPTLRNLLQKTDLPERSQSLDPGNAIEGLCNQFAALFEVHTERLGIVPSFHANLKLSPQQDQMYKYMAKTSAAAMVRKGGGLTSKEFQRSVHGQR